MSSALTLFLFIPLFVKGTEYYTDAGNKELSWNQAENACIKHYRHLASAHTNHELTAMYNECKKQDDVCYFSLVLNLKE